MKTSKLQYEANALRMEKMIFGIETIAVYIAALFTSALLPSLLFQYVYKNANPFEQPAVIQYIPVAAFIIATAYFVYATVMIIGKANKVKQLEKEMLEMGDCCCGECGDMDELKALEDMAMAEIEKAEKKAPAKKKTTRKAKKK